MLLNPTPFADMSTAALISVFLQSPRLVAVSKSIQMALQPVFQSAAPWHPTTTPMILSLQCTSLQVPFWRVATRGQRQQVLSGLMPLHAAPALYALRLELCGVLLGNLGAQVLAGLGTAIALWILRLDVSRTGINPGRAQALAVVA